MKFCFLVFSPRHRQYRDSFAPTACPALVITGRGYLNATYGRWRELPIPSYEACLPVLMMDLVSM